MKIFILFALIATTYCHPNGFYENFEVPEYHEGPSGISKRAVEFFPVEDLQEYPVKCFQRFRRAEPEYSITPHLEEKDGVQNAGVTATRKTDNHDTKVFYNKDVNRRGKPNWGVGGRIRW